MSDYISRETVLEHYRVTDPAGTFAQCESILDFVSHLPAADVKPVVRGKWEERNVEGEHIFFNRRFYCSACGGWNTYGKPKYCPNCGARMER